MENLRASLTLDLQKSLSSNNREQLPEPNIIINESHSNLTNLTLSLQMGGYLENRVEPFLC
jgi:hypothetical protein